MTQPEHGGYAGDADQLTLGLFLESLGEDVVRVVATPNGVDVPVAGIVIYDAAERSAISPGTVVLAVGVRPDTSESATFRAPWSCDDALAGIRKMASAGVRVLTSSAVTVNMGRSEGSSGRPNRRAQASRSAPVAG